jgi:hypothetical protein
VKTSIFDENVVRANRSYNDEHGQEAEAPRKNTVEIDNSRSDGLLEMRAASPISKKSNRENNSAQDLAPIGSVVLVARGRGWALAGGIYDRAEEQNPERHGREPHARPWRGDSCGF